MKKILRINVEDPNFIEDDYTYDHPVIHRYECEHILKSCENESEGDFERAINTLINFFTTKGLYSMVVDIDKRNKELAPTKEMTIDDIEKELGYKIKIVKEKK